MSSDDDDPVVEIPDEVVADGSDNLHCWMPGSDHRECTGACAAFDPGFHQEKKRSQCMVLNTLRSGALSLAKLVNVVHTFTGQSKSQRLADQINKSPAPPEVR